MGYRVTRPSRELFLQLSGDSDLRGFQNAIRGSLILVVCVILLILTTPFLASYVLMNLVLFFLMFAVGFLTAGTSGLSFWGLFSWLTIEAFVGTNPQVPVSSQTIIDNFVGLGFGMWIATIVSRLLWPILPQKVLRHSLLAICDRIKALLSGDPHQEKILTQLANLTVEALAAARQIRIAGVSKHERQKLVAMIHALQISVSRISQLVSRRNQLPEVAEPIMRPRFAHLEIEFMQMLDACADPLTLSTTIPLVPAWLTVPPVTLMSGPTGVGTAFVTAAGGQLPPSVSDIMHPPGPPPHPVALALFPTLKKIRSVAPLLSSVTGEASSPLAFTKLRQAVAPPSGVVFITPVVLNPTRHKQGRSRLAP